LSGEGFKIASRESVNIRKGLHRSLLDKI